MNGTDATYYMYHDIFEVLREITKSSGIVVLHCWTVQTNHSPNTNPDSPTDVAKKCKQKDNIETLIFALLFLTCDRCKYMFYDNEGSTSQLRQLSPHIERAASSRMSLPGERHTQTSNLLNLDVLRFHTFPSTDDHTLRLQSWFVDILILHTLICTSHAST